MSVQQPPIDELPSTVSGTETIIPKPKLAPKRVAAKDKVVVRFRAAGNAPIMKQAKFKITANESFQTVIDFLRRQLKFNQHDSLFLYINQAFQPSPDELVINLFKVSECAV
ncbi:hypothetical protein SARC_02650 [Sphaeroforma arctica JP610]|uniref:Ubiquitin-like protein ATG12 n=1 Tax=Sphaeroforma arctica JP610 TaxID=667725 RepID=A0A0L0G805_9EUKA|nr:hypothetical protein SARC_02650 [Sphaeroforma arctica JP610]KNC85157.1 hypothetical protein SARC_02650 [Sphaeroforma arctica JP610]|eukprot:XP_014159059.1 hypothetical protein SARC_02650 [Sphaeroforma arctica JP610]